MVVKLGYGWEVLVRIDGLHLDSNSISADERYFGATWQPVAFEVRNEGEG